MLDFRSIGFKLFLAGFFLIFAGVILIVISYLTSGNNVSAGIIIFVGPIPIIVGVGPHAFFAVFLAAATLTILCSILFFFIRRKEK